MQSTESEGIKKLKRNMYKGRGLAVFTSGGDAQGMNSAVRAVVRVGLYVGCKVYFIREGYQGMVDGAEYIVEANWSSVSSIIHKGGTVIGSARCMDFIKFENRLKAAKNLIDKEITHLVAIGGDGTLTGADIFRHEWASILDILLKDGKITNEQKEKCKNLMIVGLVASIDNDVCGTDMTIGADTALYRIIEAIDVMVSTAYSLQRTFVVEVMGRHCGYLALVSAITTEADYMFIPEEPPVENWEKDMCDKLQQERQSGQRLNFIIVAEGALDMNGNPITIDQIKDVVEKNLHQVVCRLSTLGYIQRGGNPSAFDRILGSRMGAEAVMAVMEASETSELCVITLDGNQAVRLSLTECVKLTKAVAEAMEKKDWAEAISLRGKTFQRNLDTYKRISQLRPPKSDAGEGKGGYVLGVIHVGAPCCGMNAAVRSFVRNCIFKGHTVIGIQDGLEGLLHKKCKKMTWSDVTGWVSQGGAYLGSKRELPGKNIGEMAKKLSELNIQGLVFIGGFESFLACIEMTEARSKYPAFQIPMIIIPSSISNNIPGTDFSVGADTALNEITEICDRIRQSAQGVKRKVFVVETMGGYCGYLATMAGLAGGADAAYIFEEKFSIKDLQDDIYYMAKKMIGGVQRGLILKNEHASEFYNTDFFCRLYSQEGKGIFSARSNILGHMQQGGSPSPFDRNLGTKLATKAVDFLLCQIKSNISPEGKVTCTDPNTACMLGVVKRNYLCRSVLDLKSEADYEHQLPKNQWWLMLRPLLQVLAKHDSAYENELLNNFPEKIDDLKEKGVLKQYEATKFTANWLKKTTHGVKP